MTDQAASTTDSILATENQHQNDLNGNVVQEMIDIAVSPTPTAITTTKQAVSNEEASSPLANVSNQSKSNASHGM